MDLTAYIESGILEMYALDQIDQTERQEVERMIAVFPEIKIEFDRIQDALEHYAASNAIKPNPDLKNKISFTISNLEKEQVMDPGDLPLINEFSDHTQWLDLVEGMIPKEVQKEGIFTHVLQQSDKVVQMLMVSPENISDEVHDESIESFLILKGRCKCTVGESVRFMEAGDYMQIPLYEHHDVEVLTENVVAILQHVLVE